MEKFRVLCAGCNSKIAEILDRQKIILEKGGHIISGKDPEVTTRCPKCRMVRKIYVDRSYEYERG